MTFPQPSGGTSTLVPKTNVALNLDDYQSFVVGLGTGVAGTEDWGPALNALWATAVAQGWSDIYFPYRATVRPIRTAVNWTTNPSVGSTVEHLRMFGAGLGSAFQVMMTDFTVPAWTINNTDAVECDLTFLGTLGVSTDAWRFIHFSNCRQVTGYLQFFGASSRVAGPSGNGDGALLSADTCCVRATVGFRGCAVAGPGGAVASDLPSLARFDNWITGSRVDFSQQTDFALYDGIDNRKTGLFSGYAGVGIKNPANTGTTGAPYTGITFTIADWRVDEGIQRSVAVLPDAGQRAPVIVIERPAMNSPSGGNGAGNHCIEATRVGLLRITDGYMGLGNGFSLTALALDDVTETIVDHMVPLNAPSQAKISATSTCGKVTVRRSPLMDTSLVNSAVILSRDDVTPPSGPVLPFGLTAARPVAPMVQDGQTYFDETLNAIIMYIGGLWVNTQTGAVVTSQQLWEADTLATANGVGIAAWSDSSGNGAPDLVQATGANQPTMQTAGINGHKAAKFTGGTQWMATAAFGAALAQPHTSLIVFQSDGTSAAQQTLSDGITGGTAADRIDLTTTNKFYRLNTGSALTSTTPIDTNPHILVVVWNGASTLAELDGTQIMAGGAGSVAPLGLTLGAQANTTNGFRGLIAVRRTDGLLSSTGRKYLTRYYGAKYGIAVAP